MERARHAHWLRGSLMMCFASRTLAREVLLDGPHARRQAIELAQLVLEGARCSAAAGWDR
jgi:hypothetical protein